MPRPGNAQVINIFAGASGVGRAMAQSLQVSEAKVTFRQSVRFHGCAEPDNIQAISTFHNRQNRTRRGVIHTGMGRTIQITHRQPVRLQERAEPTCHCEVRKGGKYSMIVDK